MFKVMRSEAHEKVVETHDHKGYLCRSEFHQKTLMRRWSSAVSFPRRTSPIPSSRHSLEILGVKKTQTAPCAPPSAYDKAPSSR